MRQELIESIRFDYEISACKKCEFGKTDNCQHYYGDGCVNGGD